MNAIKYLISMLIVVSILWFILTTNVAAALTMWCIAMAMLIANTIFFERK